MSKEYRKVSHHGIDIWVNAEGTRHMRSGASAFSVPRPLEDCNAKLFRWLLSISGK